MELEVRIDATAKTITFVREGDTMVGVLSDIPTSMRFFACFGGSNQYVTIVSGGATNGAGAAGGAANQPPPPAGPPPAGPIRVGDMVRVQTGISKPQHGWGSVKAGDVGR